MKTPHKTRIQVAITVLSELVKSINEIDRSKAVELLRETYTSRKLQPIKGKTTPQDIYDKEMSTLYVIGKYGLKLDSEYPELFEKVFYTELELDAAVECIYNSKYDKAREILKNVSISGLIDSNTIARMLRIPLTKLIMGFMSEEEFKIILHKTLEAIPEEEKTIRNYARFFVGLKLAESIFKGEIRTREEKEALKKALAIRIGFAKSTPSDDYIREIGKSVFNIPEKILDKVLSNARGERNKEDYA